MTDRTQPLTLPPGTVAQIRRLLGHIDQDAQYLRHWAADVEEHSAARSVQRLARKIGTLLDDDGKAAA